MQVIAECKVAMRSFLLGEKHSVIKADRLAARQAPVLRQNEIKLVGRR